MVVTPSTAMAGTEAKFAINHICLNQIITQTPSKLTAAAVQQEQGATLTYPVYYCLQPACPSDTYTTRNVQTATTL